MPLHDWSRTHGWGGVQLYWLCELAQAMKPLMPHEERVYVGHSPVVPNDSPAPSVRWGRGERPPRKWWLDDAEPDPFQPDRKAEAGPGLLDHSRSCYVEHDGRLIAVIELAPDSYLDPADLTAKYVTRYLGYLTNGVHLLLVDVHPRPGPSLAEQVLRRLGLADEPLPAPNVVSFRVHPDKPGGFSSIAWRRAALAVGRPLPSVPLALSFPQVVPVDLETTYRKAATAAYLA